MSLKQKLLSSGRSITVELEGEKVTIKEPSYADAVKAQSMPPADGQAYIVAKYLLGGDGEPILTQDEAKALPLHVMQTIDAKFAEIQKVDVKNA